MLLLWIHVVAFFTAKTLADCCYPDDRGLCADGTLGTPRCGYGKCNLLGCDCTGGKSDCTATLDSRLTLHLYRMPTECGQLFLSDCDTAGVLVCVRDSVRDGRTIGHL